MSAAPICSARSSTGRIIISLSSATTVWNGDRIPEPREPFGQRLLPECRRGARLVIHDVGAYGASMGYSYGLTPHCAEYLYQADGTLRCIRRAQREDELFSTLDENPDFTAPAETPSGQAESQRPSEG